MNPPPCTTRARTQRSLAVLLIAGLTGSLAWLGLAPPGAQAGSSDVRTPVGKGLREAGQAWKASKGPIVLRKGRQAYLRFRVPGSWEGDRIELRLSPSNSASEGVTVRRVRLSWRKGIPGRATVTGSREAIRTGSLTGGQKAGIDISSILSPGRRQSVRLTIPAGSRLRLGRIPFLRSQPPSATTISAVGDIACSPDSSQWNGGTGTATDCRQADVASLVEDSDEAVLLLGDVQYPDGTLTQFQTGFGPSWGSLANRMKPTPGNHEYYTPGASGYYDYFESLGIETGGAGVGYYAFDLGDWTFLSLNSNCSDVPCSAGSAQELWLREQLEEARNLDRCTLAYWHHPPASSGIHGDTAAVADLWRAFVDLGGDLLLAGHDHHYERFAPLSADLEPDSSGPPSWVIGTGGKSLRSVSGTRAGSEKVIDDAFGLTRFRLAANSFEWEWVGLGNVGSDTGSADCRA